MRLFLISCAALITLSGCYVHRHYRLPVRQTPVVHYHIDQYDVVYHKPLWQKLAEAEAWRQARIRQARLHRQQLRAVERWRRSHHRDYRRSQPQPQNQQCQGRNCPHRRRGRR